MLSVNGEEVEQWLLATHQIRCFWRIQLFFFLCSFSFPFVSICDRRNKTCNKNKQNKQHSTCNLCLKFYLLKHVFERAHNTWCEWNNCLSLSLNFRLLAFSQVYHFKHLRSKPSLWYFSDLHMRTYTLVILDWFLSQYTCGTLFPALTSLHAVSSVGVFSVTQVNAKIGTVGVGPTNQSKCILKNLELTNLVRVWYWSYWFSVQTLFWVKQQLEPFDSQIQELSRFPKFQSHRTRHIWTCPTTGSLVLWTEASLVSRDCRFCLSGTIEFLQQVFQWIRWLGGIFNILNYINENSNAWLVWWDNMWETTDTEHFVDVNSVRRPPTLLSPTQKQRCFWAMNSWSDKRVKNCRNREDEF